MKIHTTNYLDTFIEVAEDCPATRGEIPLSKNDAKTVASIQFEIISRSPYKFTSDDILFQVYADRRGLSSNELQEERKRFFSKGQPCFRASPLSKRYGWGVHSDEEGRIAIFGLDSAEYKILSGNPKIKKLKAMKSSKKR